MNFRQVVENAENNATQFDFDFLDTLLMCQQYVHILKQLKNGKEMVFTESQLINKIRGHAETLRCFINCCK